MLTHKSYTPQQAMLKAANYCAYQERCYKEVEAKLSEWGVYGTDAGEIMIKLSEQNYLNEERFAFAFAGGKFRTKKWGITKIKRELKQRDISEYCIKKAISQLENNDNYVQTLTELCTKKFNALTDQNIFTKKNKVAKWLMQKGYESTLIWETINNIK